MYAMLGRDEGDWVGLLLDIMEFQDGTSGNLRARQLAHHIGGLIRGKY